MYNRIAIVIDNGDEQVFDINQNDRVYMQQIISNDSKTDNPKADNIFALMSILAYAKIVGRNAVTYGAIEKWVDEHNVFVEAEAPKASRTVDTDATSSE
jgi:hypothetical protein